MAVAPVREGEVLAGKYRVERVLGVGGMGVVVAATDLGLERRVAIKFLLPDAAHNPEVVARFVREARAAVKIESEHVARVIDVGQLPDGAPYMVMEYLQGSDLGEVVSQRGALPADEAIEYVLQACEAVAEAHALGIVHRDLKPANLFLARRQDGSARVKVLDFGISKATAAPGAAPDMGLTKTSAVMGSPLYMAPEQMRSTRSVDVRADIWALGVILYELLSGRVPFEATTMPELCAMVLTESPPPLSERRPDLPRELCAIVERCLAKAPEGRWRNIAELAQALFVFAPGRARVSVERIGKTLRAAGIATESLPAPSARAPTGAVSARTGDSTDTTWNPADKSSIAPKRRTVALAGAAAAMLVVAVVAIALTRRGGPSTAGSAPAVAPEAPSSVVAATAAQPSVAPPSVAPAVEPASEPAVPSAAPSASAAPPSAPVRTPGSGRVRAPARAASATPTPAAQPAPPAPPTAKKNPLDIGLK